jgi:hypothetical protein
MRAVVNFGSAGPLIFSFMIYGNYDRTCIFGIAQLKVIKVDVVRSVINFSVATM